MMGQFHKFLKIVIGSVIAAFGLAVSANADTVSYDLTSANVWCQTGCGTEATVYGTATITENTLGGLTVTVTLNAPYTFDAASGSGYEPSFALSLMAPGTADSLQVIDIAQFPDFSSAPGGKTTDGLGAFPIVVDWTNAPANEGTGVSELSFSIYDSNGDLNIGDIVQNDHGLYVAADIMGPVPATPEPSTWVTMLIGFAGAGYLAYGRSKKAVPHAVA